MIKNIILFFVSALAFGAYAESFSLSPGEIKQIDREAEDWIDDMPEGLQDRLSDAVSHALRGFYSEISYIRNLSDTTDLNSFSVDIKDIKGGVNSDIPMRFYSADDGKEKSLFIYLHGGGWSLGSIGIGDRFCKALASKGNVKVISVEYPLAPEHPYPAAINTCLDAVRFILENSKNLIGEVRKISLGGDGAGGNLALECFSRMNSSEEISSLVLFYPLISTANDLDPESKKLYGRGYGFDSRLLEVFTEAYNEATQSEIKNLPPTLLISAERDIIIKEEKEFSSKNPEIIYVEFPGALHGFITDGHQNAAFNKAVELADIFLSK